MTDARTMIRVQRHLNGEYIVYHYDWEGPEDAAVPVTPELLEQLDGDLNNAPSFPWKMVKVGEDELYTYWKREEYAK